MRASKTGKLLGNLSESAFKLAPSRGQKMIERVEAGRECKQPCTSGNNIRHTT